MGGSTGETIDELTKEWIATCKRVEVGAAVR